MEKQKLGMVQPHMLRQHFTSWMISEFDQSEEIGEDVLSGAVTSMSVSEEYPLSGCTQTQGHGGQSLFGTGHQSFGFLW